MRGSALDPPTHDDININIYIYIYRKSGNFRVKNISSENISLSKFFVGRAMLRKMFTHHFLTLYLGSGRPSRGLKYCLIDITETLTDSLACSRSIKIASVQDRVTTVYTYSLHTCS